MFDYDAELRRHQSRLTAALEVGPRDIVLDIGCGTGQTTRTAARLAVRGTAFGVDISAPMVARARELAAAEGIGNIGFEHADAQDHSFPSAHFTLGISRFGTMFFADPLAAFGNIARALRPDARLVQLVWQRGDRQEWVVAMHRALTGTDPAPADLAGGAFSLADPDAMDDILTTAGFRDIRRTEVRESLWYGTDPDAAVAAVRALRMVADLLAPLAAADAADALVRLRATMAAHCRADGVWFDSRAWLVTARR
ncbi:class I SAM-dependent methyltransferase [Nocardia sp. CDC159]|uniref:Class I SAM-dependent methyltransferase n=1 Tax=Nocardia pulmonis TaxID=2951408 RepID=A0A9X2E3F0_9NOCA|nr:MULTISPECIES: class I SAM-dependent methyltransferase [Nocardia]MCM6772383.1 class I SAM-dependent methyltransferase [Nocardia pulmonis]MCM6784959.1 class I SAM-dependent methyltransferase [Nocardia sp. CDC159]